ncbi:MAG: restriction endonuclease subunit S [Opitutaceae bacterium]|nr:restriction endonuclease subunit S [Opitutaceae bacterium]
MKTGISDSGLNLTHGRFLKLQVPVPPVSEQRRIVAEIEKQFTRLDAGVAALRRVQANLKRYRAAVLKAACEGKLVPTEAELAAKNAKSPKKNSGSVSAFSAVQNLGYETGEQLLQRILAERRKNWAGRGKYEEPIPPSTKELPSLPDGWTWASINQLAAETMIGLDRGRAQQRDDPSFGVPYIKMNNVTMEGRVLYEDMAYVPADMEESERFAVQDGDILFNTRNSKELVGKIGIARNPPRGAIYNNNLMRIRVPRGVTPAFLCLQMCSHEFRRRMELVKKATTNVAAVYAKDLLPLAIALPPHTEQTRIVAEVDRRLSVVEELETLVHANLQRSARLRQSTLQKAFTGELL